MATEIISRVAECFDRARSAGDLFFFPSTIHKHEEQGIQFEIRLCPALQKKPILPVPQFDNDGSGATLDTGVGVVKSRPDPFAPPYIPNLFVGELKDDDGEEFVILLNKFSVVPCHFLLVPKEYKSQSSPLYPPELVQSYLLLDAARKAGRSYFAFYNCGERSGASQGHKHIQFLPLEDDGPPIERVARTIDLQSSSKAFSINALPYATHVRRLPHLSSSTPRETIEETLGEAFMALLDLAISTVRHDPVLPVGQPSYNVILTLSHMYIVPRKLECHVLSETGDDLSVNSLGFAGMLLVKSEQELNAVKKEGIVKILRNVGLANVQDLQVTPAHEADD